MWPGIFFSFLFDRIHLAALQQPSGSGYGVTVTIQQRFDEQQIFNVLPAIQPLV